MNSWDKCEITPIVLSGSVATYPLEKATKNLEDAEQVVYIAHRVPASGAYSQDGTGTNKLLIDATIYNAARLILKDKNGTEKLVIPLSAIGIKENNPPFFELPENFLVDFRYGKSQVTLHCTSGIISTASTAGQMIEILVFYKERC